MRQFLQFLAWLSLIVGLTLVLESITTPIETIQQQIANRILLAIAGIYFCAGFIGLSMLCRK